MSLEAHESLCSSIHIHSMHVVSSQDGLARSTVSHDPPNIRCGITSDLTYIQVYKTRICEEAAWKPIANLTTPDFQTGFELTILFIRP